MKGLSPGIEGEFAAEPTARRELPGPNGGDPQTGTLIGEYRIGNELGRGGMGVVYAAIQPIIGKRVAIKVLSRCHSQDAVLVRRFLDEARAVNRIEHPNIIDIFGFGTLADGRPYFVMEYLPGETLSQHLAGGRLPWEQACRLLWQAADALGAAHRARIVHRDLKPGNIWISPSAQDAPRVKVLDFGIAKLLDAAGEDGLTATGMVMGTPHYMAPEQCTGEEVDQRSDIYALGVILYRACTGQLPVTGASFAEVVAQHALGSPRRPAQLAPLPPALDALIMACLQRNPAQRPSAQEVSARLRSIADGMQGARSATRDSTAGRRRSGTAAHAWLAAGLVVLSGLWWASAPWRTARFRAGPSPSLGTSAAQPDPREGAHAHRARVPPPTAAASAQPEKPTVSPDQRSSKAAVPRRPPNGARPRAPSPVEAHAAVPRRPPNGARPRTPSPVEAHGLIEQNPF